MLIEFQCLLLSSLGGVGHIALVRFLHTIDLSLIHISSDRLEIAREVDSRITNIYADLVSLEKMMHYKRSIIDVLKDILPSIDADQGRRRTLIEECYERWRENADPNRGDGDENENENENEN